MKNFGDRSVCLEPRKRTEVWCPVCWTFHSGRTTAAAKWSCDRRCSCSAVKNNPFQVTVSSRPGGPVGYVRGSSKQPIHQSFISSRSFVIQRALCGWSQPALVTQWLS